MNRDILIALKDAVPRSVTVPLSLGAVRADVDTSNSPSVPPAWFADAISAHENNMRPVFSGDIGDPEELALWIDTLRAERPAMRFALLLHWTQALKAPFTDALRSRFDDVFVAVDQMIEKADAHKIRASVHPRWVLLTRLDLDWKLLIADRLLPERRGSVTVFAPPADSSEGRFLSADELSVVIADFRIRHPLIDLRPAPPEWYVPMEIGPWRKSARSPLAITVTCDRRTNQIPRLGFIVPLLWTSYSETAIENLVRNLQSCLRFATSVEETEIEFVIAVDRLATAPPFDVAKLISVVDPVVAARLRVVESMRSEINDWRAGFMRMCGTLYSRVPSSGMLIFIDADIEFADFEVTAQMYNSSSRTMVYASTEALGGKGRFETASSKMMMVPRGILESVGGFASAFSSYGCEDNFLVWLILDLKKRGHPQAVHAMPSSVVRHLRDSSAQDDLIAKMIRLQKSADLMYRMTLDPDVHRHFFVTFGNHLGLRYLLKRLSSFLLGRIFLGPIVFFLTLFETDRRIEYLRGFWDIAKWKLKRPFIFLGSEIWRFGQVVHAWRAHAWKLPNRIGSQVAMVRIALERLWIRLRSARFGLNATQWRITVLWQRMGGLFKKWRTSFFVEPVRLVKKEASWRTNVASKKIVGAIAWRPAVVGQRTAGALRYGLVLYVREPVKRLSGFCRATSQSIAWKTRIGILRTLGFGGRVFGAIKKFVVDFIAVPVANAVRKPFHFFRLHGWKVRAYLLPLLIKFGWQIRHLIAKINHSLRMVRIRIAAFWNLHAWKVPYTGSKLFHLIGEPWRQLRAQLWRVPILLHALGEPLRILRGQAWRVRIFIGRIPSIFWKLVRTIKHSWAGRRSKSPTDDQP